MSSQPDQEIEGIYMDYLHEAQRIFKEQQRIYLPYIVAAFLLFIASGVACYAGLSLMVSPRTGSWLYWISLIVAILVGIVGAIKARKYASLAAAQASGSKPGFERTKG